ncbi:MULTISPECIES: hypothetical protein [unclassified Sphingobium]|uniref:hypothetical protein n=1 Tax=unclassified Sphingobium TaxID=2611147 RepID=UPI00082E29F8|nr:MULTISPECIES: hypothetical protein [unclassified Sphingobium]WIW90691.1 hypothetical protein K3M67_16605 [Sphingobium sp. V4]
MTIKTITVFWLCSVGNKRQFLLVACHTLYVMPGLTGQPAFFVLPIFCEEVNVPTTPVREPL